MSVAVVIPSHGRPVELARCLEALARQEGGPYPAVVIDDGSPEPLAPVCARFPFVRCVRQEQAGPAAARNRGVAESGAETVCFTDDDCLAHSTWVQALVAAQGGAAMRLVGGRIENALLDNPYAAASQSIANHVTDWLARSGGAMAFFSSNSLCCRRADFERVGGFDPGFRFASEDRDFCLRWADAGGTLAFTAEAVVDHAHALDLPGFWCQQMAYGRGARRLHGRMAGRGDRRRRLQGLRFYAGLLTHPLRRPGRHRLSQAALVGLGQLALTAGYLAEARNQRRPG